MEIVKASAGSGKTYTLAKKYIELLFSSREDHAYRHILAVTFTNKATEEMKGRILRELFTLSTEPEKSGYFKDFVPAFARSGEELRQKSENILCNILHDYRAFAVSTIDRFFQQTLKAFSREIGQFTSYQVELDADSLVEESVDRMLDALSENDSQLLRWLTDNVLEQIQDGGRYSLEKSLKDVAKKLRSHEYRDLVETLGIDEKVSCSRKELSDLKKKCREIISNFSEEAEGQERMEYNTAKIIEGQLCGLGVAGEFSKILSELMKEKNVLCITDSDIILKGIIDGSDAPFIYEKLGVRYEHFLLDEFQDTSRIQWENFLPLLHNSHAQGFENLIVGDVKQSIYRWRNSDWKMLDSEVEREFTGSRTAPLQTNYRSLANIVAFNNAFFLAAAKALDEIYGHNDGRSISDIYADVEQKVAAKDNAKGSVSLTWSKPSDEKNEVLAAIGQVRSRGAAYSDIAILVRNNAEGGDIASFLIDNGIPVVTDDSLSIKSSIVIRRLVSLMSLLENPENTIEGFLASSLNVTLPESYHSLVSLAETLLCSLREVDPDMFSGETLYIQSFMDVLQDYVSLNGNILRGFLKYWEDSDLKISSPTLGDSVRIMTVHKSKGLAFPYVIFPYAEKVRLSRPGGHWCRLDRDKLKGTGFEDMPPRIFDVNLSSKTEDTFFADSLKKETKLQYVDNLNVLYVTLTRPAKGIHIIAKTPPKTCIRNIQKGRLTRFADMSQLMYWFVYGNADRLGFMNMTDMDDDEAPIRYVLGDIYDFAGAEKKDGASREVQDMPADYPSWPLGGRLAVKSDGAEFFAKDGSAGISASHRLRGIVLHDILSRVAVPSDLPSAVAQAKMDGYIGEDEAGEIQKMLSDRIVSASARGWFPSDGTAIMNEVSLIDTDGSVYRPDRMVVAPDGSLTIVDYKFGEHRKAYDAQIARYADICRRMGYDRVSAHLWYVDTDEIR